MARQGRQAQILDPKRHLPTLLDACAGSRYPHRDRVVVLLSVRAGLRRMEIAGLKRRHVLGPSGDVGTHINLEDRICKQGSGGRIPIHPELRQALFDLLQKSPGLPNWPLILSERAEAAATGRGTSAGETTRSAPLDEPYHMRADAIGYLFYRLYRKAGLTGCSSHSGRRTFGTLAARRAMQTPGGSIRDVQVLLRHQNLATTQKYIEANSEVHEKLVDF
ncbi:site-specific integrase [Roseospira marina]|uniref:Site-specific integrase n=1 Tax=Roseospira marina TaxID=140057 RepID=A0A5M6I6R1_9PROT|nr:site-specific integrase [Roseospira marina]KAA5603498.1 site-specific integrase [Roseospira marina]MBB4315474.1 integrase/recombinase XerD [Roseospira marina]MBB5088380.1 integrase/recombinase XerD [Roseospira marina]